MSIKRIFVFIFLYMLGGSVHLLMAQNNNQQQGEGAASLLPEIDPQDIEIRSEYQARFPGLHRQPILGFNPKEQTFQVDPNRKPFIESPDERVADISIVNLTRPQAPAYHLYQYPENHQAIGYFGVGSFLSPEARVYASQPLSNNTLLYGRLRHFSSKGHLDRKSSFRNFNGEVGLASMIDQHNQFDINLGGHSDFNYLFNLTPEIDTTIIKTNPRKDYSGGHVGGTFTHIKNSVEGWKAGLNYRNFKLDMNAGQLSGLNTEDEVDGSFAYTWAGTHIHETYKILAGGKYGSYKLPVSGVDYWNTLRAGLRYRRLFNYKTCLTLEGQGYFTKDRKYDNRFYFVPKLALEYWFSDRLKFTARLDGNVHTQSLYEQNMENEFLTVNRDGIVHTYDLKGTAEATFQLFKGNKITGGISYKSAQNYLYYRRSNLVDANGNGHLTYYDAYYGDAKIARVYASFTQDLIPEKFWINGEVYYQQHKLDTMDDIPFMENTGVHGGFSLKPFNKLIVNGWANYTGKRFDPDHQQKLKAFLLIGGRADFQLNEQIGFYAKVVNLLNQHYQVWDGYRERPMQIYGGVILKL